MEVNQSGGYYQFSRGGKIFVLIQPYNSEKLWYAKDGENLHLIPDPNLLEVLEKEYFDYRNPIKNVEPNTKDILNFVFDAIKNRTDYDSHLHQPHSRRVIQVKSASNSSELYVVDELMYYYGTKGDQKLIATFYEDRCVLMPQERMRNTNLKKFFGLLFHLIHEEYSAPLYYYKKCLNGKTSQIWRHRIILGQHVNERLIKVFDEPITIPLHSINSDEDDGFLPIRTALKLSTKRLQEAKSMQ
jgi:hypothetical protein